jgi:hypothetical protein
VHLSNIFDKLQVANRFAAGDIYRRCQPDTST